MFISRSVWTSVSVNRHTFGLKLSRFSMRLLLFPFTPRILAYIIPHSSFLCFFWLLLLLLLTFSDTFEKHIWKEHLEGTLGYTFGMTLGGTIGTSLGDTFGDTLGSTFRGCVDGGLSGKISGGRIWSFRWFVQADEALWSALTVCRISQIWLRVSSPMFETEKMDFLMAWASTLMSSSL